MGFEDAARRLATRIANLVGRAVVKRVDDSTGVQELQLEFLPGELRSEIERFGQFGLTSRPPEGAEAVVVFVGGRREHGLAIACEDRRYRIQNLEHVATDPAMPYTRSCADFLDDAHRPKPPQDVGGARLTDTKLLLYIPNRKDWAGEQ